MAWQWTGDSREFEIDLSGVATREAFETEILRHFRFIGVGRDPWAALVTGIIEQDGPYRLRFVGWPGFAQRMPRYARRLRRIIETYQGTHGTGVLAVAYV